jgi:hypothetical protein
MRILYLDCLRGINAVAALAALIDAGADPSEIGRHLRFLPGPVSLGSSDRLVEGFRVRRIEVRAPRLPDCRRLEDVEELVEQGDLSAEAKRLVLGIYGRLAAAEARVHGSTPEAVTFHEVGVARSVVAVLGAALALELLGPARVIASPFPTGGGVVDTQHGRLPVPTPATLELLRDRPMWDTGRQGELVTPSGVALVTQVAASFGPCPSMVVERIGYGTDDQREPAPVTRVIAGRGTRRHGWVKPRSGSDDRPTSRRLLPRGGRH